jgi:hypothetical protein
MKAKSRGTGKRLKKLAVKKKVQYYKKPELPQILEEEPVEDKTPETSEVSSEDVEVIL